MFIELGHELTEICNLNQVIVITDSCYKFAVKVLSYCNAVLGHNATVTIRSDVEVKLWKINPEYAEVLC